MKNFLLAFSILSFGGLASSPELFAQQNVPHNDVIHREMEAMGRNYQALGRQLGNRDQNASSIELLQALIQSAVVSQAEVPARADTLQGEARDQYIQDYRNDMQALIDHFTHMQSLLRNNDNTAAVAENAEVGLLIRAAHQKYRFPR